jgi:hypothetical protein
VPVAVSQQLFQRLPVNNVVLTWCSMGTTMHQCTGQALKHQPAAAHCGCHVNVILVVLDAGRSVCFLHVGWALLSRWKTGSLPGWLAGTTLTQLPHGRLAYQVVLCFCCMLCFS